jgi:hypothetical protein
MNKKIVLITLAAIAVIVCLVAVMLVRDSKPPVYNLSGGILDIKCSFGVSVPAAEITGLELTENAPEIKTKTNGADVGSVLKGEFLLEDGSKARLYVDAQSSPFIRFTWDGWIFYINAATREETEALYKNIEALSQK